jgi:hypothetical protein
LGPTLHGVWHAPQWGVDVLGSKQPPSHSISPALQPASRSLQEPLSQSPPSQVTLQLPQCAGSPLVGSVSQPSARSPLQSMKGRVQSAAHCPALQMDVALAGPGKGWQSVGVPHPTEGSDASTHTPQTLQGVEPESPSVAASERYPMSSTLRSAAHATSAVPATSSAAATTDRPANSAFTAQAYLRGDCRGEARSRRRQPKARQG